MPNSPEQQRIVARFEREEIATGGTGDGRPVCGGPRNRQNLSHRLRIPRRWRWACRQIARSEKRHPHERFYEYEDVDTPNGL